MRSRLLAGLMLFCVVGASDVEAQTRARLEWTSAWATAQENGPARSPVSRPPSPPDPTVLPSPVIPYPDSLRDHTVRMTLRPTIGGEAVKIQLSNGLGRPPLRVGAAHIGVRGQDSSILPGTDRAVTFGGKPSVVIPPGAIVVSDAVKLTVKAEQDLAVSLFTPEQDGGLTTHQVGLNAAYIAKGDLTAAASLPGAEMVRSYFWLTGLEVLASNPRGVIVAFGDSITDGYATSPDQHRTWPEALARRLNADARTRGWAVTNAGISGNRILLDGAGVSGLARFDRDVLSQPGVKWVILLEGVNDINFSAMRPGEAVSADQIIAGYKLFVDKAHLHGVKVMGATLTPTEGLRVYSEATEATRSQLNAWIRTSGYFDAVVDFDAAVRDPARPVRLKPEFDPGDHIHPNDAGSLAMANAIDLSAFRK